MVTTNSPYTRTTWVEDFAWNEIIQEVNILATNPDEGCDPVETLEEVEEDHIWNKEDIKEVQDKLKEICPDNEFTELGELWTSVIINEIIDALETGWCECEPVLDEWLLGTWITQKAYGDQVSAFGANYNKCGGRKVETPWWHFTGQDECEYMSPCYDSQEHATFNAALLLARAISYQEAFENTTDWIKNRRDELLQQRLVEQYADQLRSKREQLIALESQLVACQSSGSDCSSIQSQISEIEADISELEGKIQEAKDKRDDYKDKAEGHLEVADAAATENWAALPTILDWDPTAFNIVKDHIGGISLEWGLGEYPYSYNWSTWGVGKTWWRAINPTLPITGTAIAGRFTPSGIPFSKGYPLIFGSEYFYQYRCRHKCGWWEALAGDCTFEEWGDWQEPTEYKSTLGWTRREGDKLELKFRQTQGTEKAEEYNPDPDQ